MILNICEGGVYLVKILGLHLRGINWGRSDQWSVLPVFGLIVPSSYEQSTEYFIYS